jgi:N-acetylmuramoyl-L-alanine amidase
MPTSASPALAEVVVCTDKYALSRTMPIPTSRAPYTLCARGCVALIAVLVAAACTRDSVRSAAPSPSPPSARTNRPSPSTTPSVSELSAPRPPIVSKLIPFPDSRKQEMRAYAQRHYGLNTFRLVRPQVIVEHFTVIETFGPVFDTFAANKAHLGELPGTCAHFVIDADGTIYQLVPLGLMCRHAVGLNHTAIGIEMVGQSDQDILGNPPQLRAALDLTLWLMQRFGIELRNVIGHNESLTSPLHRELVPSFRCQTHQDWNHADMETFRGQLALLAETFRVPLGPPATPVDSGC